jgi:class 3 adenylate cyclase
VSSARCDRCGSPLPAGARFCPNCGAALGGVAREERRIVTLLFADVAESTKLAARLDAERLRDIMSAFFAQAERVFESLRGRAVSVAGDAVMAAFGFPRAEDDDALRAIRAGLQLRDGVEQLGRERGLPTPLRVRVGINTGPVAIGAGIIEPHHLAGVEVNLAARLQQAAEPGEILVSENTWRLTRDAVAFGPGRAVSAKGFDSKIVVRPVEALSARSSRRTIRWGVV